MECRKYGEGQQWEKKEQDSNRSEGVESEGAR